METSEQRISVKILGKEYQVACPQGQEADLANAAYNLDKKMAKIKNSGKVYGLERIAVMTALNLTHELLQTEKKQQQMQAEVNESIHNLDRKLDTALADTKNYISNKSIAEEYPQEDLIDS